MRVGSLTLAALFVVATSAVQAQTITFDSSSGAFAQPPDTVTIEGFDFTPQNGSNSFINVTNQADIVGNGTPKLFVANHTILTVSHSTPFALSAFDVGGSFSNNPDRWADSVEVTGNLVGGGTVSTTVDIPDTNPVLMTAFLPTTFNNLSSVVFAPIGNANGGTNNFEFVLDNIVTAPAAVPEPSSVALLVGMSVTGAAFLRRRKQAPKAA